MQIYKYVRIFTKIVDEIISCGIFAWDLFEE